MEDQMKQGILINSFGWNFSENQFFPLPLLACLVVAENGTFRNILAVYDHIVCKLKENSRHLVSYTLSFTLRFKLSI